MKKQDSKKLFQLKIQLKNFKPSIYRTLIVSEDDNFSKLHDYIQNSFWFYDYHLWHFYKRVKWRNYLEITDMDEDFEAYFDKSLNPKRTKLSKIFVWEAIEKISYEYDYWDSWEFDISLQKIIPNDWILEYPKLLKAKWWMLIEDCGWTRWLEELVNDYNNKKFDEDMFEDWEDFEEYMNPFFEWIGDINDFKL